MLRNTKLDSVVSYFMVSCDSLKNQWVCELKDLYMNFGEVTNNRFESKFNKLKTIYKPNAVLLRDFNIYISNKKRYKSSSFNDTKLQKDAANKNKIGQLEQLTPNVRKQLQLIDKQAEINIVDKNTYTQLPVMQEG